MKRVAPRLPSPVPAASSSSADRLPDDVVAAQVQRLLLFSVVSGGLWAIGLVMEVFVHPRILGLAVSKASIFIEISAIVTAIAVYFYVRYWHCAPRIKTDAGLWLMMLNSADIALLETWAINPSEKSMGHISWIAVVILLSAMILPGTPRKMLAAALASASMGPLGVWIAYLRGVPVPSPLTTLVLYVPNYTCAIAAVLPSQMFERMGRRLREARELGNYELMERLGAGGMGEVWRARHRLLARPAAIKLIRPDVLGTGSGSDARQTLRRFEREAQATAALSSQHSIRLFDFGATEEGSFYYVMELLNGRDLESLIREFGPLPVARVLYLIRQACHSLAEAHACGLVHRDVKPANIFVCRMGLDYDFVKVLDFGLVQRRDRETDQGITETMGAGHIVGTPAYMAPETILGKGPVDRRADVYALGCVAYFLLTGERVFSGGTAMQSLVDHVHTAPKPPSQRTELPIPPQVDEIVLACLEKEPEKRPQDAADLLRRIMDCNECGEWSSEQAQRWWLSHLPDLTAPLTIEKASSGQV